jgi:hypothetical protein
MKGGNQERMRGRGLSRFWKNANILQEENRKEVWKRRSVAYRRSQQIAKKGGLTNGS